MKTVPMIAAQFKVLLVLLVSTGIARKAQGQSLSDTQWTHQSTGPTITRDEDGLLSEILGVAFSPDGKTMAAGDTRGTIRLYDIDTTRKRKKLEFPNPFGGRVSLLAYSPDGNQLLVEAGSRGEVALIDAITGSIRLALEVPLSVNHSSPICLAYAPDGKTVAAGISNGEVLLWDASTGRLRAVTSPHIIPPHTPPFERADHPLPGPIRALTYTPDAKTLLAVAVGGPIRSWDVSTGVERTPPVKLDRSRLMSLSPDGKFLVLTARFDDSIDSMSQYSFYELPTWQKRSEWTSANRPENLAFLPSGHALISLEREADGPNVRLRDAASGRTLATLRFDLDGYYDSLALSPDGKLIAIGGSRRPGFGIIQLIETDGETLRPWRQRP